MVCTKRTTGQPQRTQHTERQKLQKSKTLCVRESGSGRRKEGAAAGLHCSLLLLCGLLLAVPGVPGRKEKEGKKGQRRIKISVLFSAYIPSHLFSQQARSLQQVVVSSLQSPHSRIFFFFFFLYAISPSLRYNYTTLRRSSSSSSTIIYSSLCPACSFWGAHIAANAEEDFFPSPYLPAGWTDRRFRWREVCSRSLVVGYKQTNKREKSQQQQKKEEENEV